MDLDPIEKRAAKYAEHTGTLRCCNAHDTADDVPALVARVRELEEENQKLRDEARLKNRAAYLNGINLCMTRLRGQAEVSAVLPALHESRDRAVELYNAALARARQLSEGGK